MSQHAVVAAGLVFKAGFAAVAAEAERRPLSSQRRLFFALLLFVRFAADPFWTRVRFFDVLPDGRGVGRLLVRLEGRLKCRCRRCYRVVATMGSATAALAFRFAPRVLRLPRVLEWQRDGDLENSFGTV